MHHYDHQKSQFGIFNTGMINQQLEKKLDMSFEDLDGMNIREQRRIVKQRVIDQQMAEAFRSKERLKSNSVMLNMQARSFKRKHMPEHNTMATIETSEQPLRASGKVEDAFYRNTMLTDHELNKSMPVTQHTIDYKFASNLINMYEPMQKQIQEDPLKSTFKTGFKIYKNTRSGRDLNNSLTLKRGCPKLLKMVNMILEKPTERPMSQLPSKYQLEAQRELASYQNQQSAKHYDKNKVTITNMSHSTAPTQGFNQVSPKIRSFKKNRFNNTALKTYNQLDEHYNHIGSMPTVDPYKHTSMNSSLLKN